MLAHRQRISVTEGDGSISIAVHPNRSVVLTLLVGGWFLGVVTLGAIAFYVLSRGRFSPPVWVFFGVGLSAMLAWGAYVGFWNLVYRKAVRIDERALTVESNGIRKRWEVSRDVILGFRFIKPWPYAHVDSEYEFFGLGLWSMEAYGPLHATRVLWGISRIAAGDIARLLQAKGFRVEAAHLLR